jgi:hypothetical protein
MVKRVVDGVPWLITRRPGLGLVWPLDEHSLLELGTGPDQAARVRAGDVAPAFAGDLDELRRAKLT